MLSAFTARPIVEFKQRDRSKIESILAYGDRLLVGLNNGALRIYRVNEPADESANGDAQAPTSPPKEGVEPPSSPSDKPKIKPTDLLREEEKFSRRPVTQLALIKEASLLLSLSDSHVSLHDLSSYALQTRLDKTRGASAFAVTSNIVKDPQTGIPSIVSRLAVAVKRKLMLWKWVDMEPAEAWDAPQEIGLPSAIKSLSWADGTKIVLGMDPGFVLVNVETAEIKEINKPAGAGEAGAQVRFGAVISSGIGYMGMGSWVPKPMATRLNEGEVLLARDVNTLFIDTDGNPLDKRQVPWAAAPEAIGYSYPYLLALPPPAKGALEVRNPDTLSLLQSVSLPNAIHLHVPQPNISLAHAGKGFLVASDRCIWRMGALDYDTQIDELVNSGRYDEAISLLSMLEDTLLKDKEGRLRETKILKAKGLFEQRKYRDAMALFAEAKAPPERVIALYPKSVAGELSSIEEAKDSEAEDREKEIDGKDADGAEANGEASVEGSKTTLSSIPPTASIGRSMFGYLKAARDDPDAASIWSGKVGSETASIRGKHTETVETDKALEGKDLKLAINELRPFLVQTRTDLKNYLNMDGSLKEPLPQPSDNQAQPAKPPFHVYISSPPENNDPEEWHQKLKEVASFVDTSLFRAYMLVSPSMAGPFFRIENFCDPDVVRDKLYESGRYSELIDFLHGKKLHREALELLQKFGKNEDDDGAVSPALRGPQRTVAYLQALSPDMIDLILEFAEWPIREQPDLGMEVFLADTENAETLPRHQVLEFLQKIDTKLAVRYLEHVIQELNDLTPEFHQQLIELYLQRLKPKDLKVEDGGFASEEERSQWRRRLQDFLKSSAQYNRARAFSQLPSDDPDFYESRAIVLSKMGQHKQALQIYVFQLQDYDKAEEYCNQVYLHSQPSIAPPGQAGMTTSSSIAAPTADPEDSTPSIYHTLLSLYLSPPHPHQPNLPPALDLLSKHGARLPASNTLALIPDDLPIRELESYFRGRVRSANSVMNEERIVRGLRGVLRASVEGKVLLGEPGGPQGGRNRRVIIGEERHCAVCHKRFGGAAIRVYPDNGVVHSGCYQRSVVGVGGAGAGAGGAAKGGSAGGAVANRRMGVGWN